jgi:anaerobic selenocysteine-containing dehydrogenase
VPQELLLSHLLRASGQGSFRSLAAEPHGRLRPAHEPGSFLGSRVLTEDGKVALAAPRLVAEAGSQLEAAFLEEQARAAAGKLRLITRRHVTTHNSWTHNLRAFVAPERDRATNHLYLHPDDARRIGLGRGSMADVSTDTAMVRLPVRIDESLMPGVVALPHGWGHQHATGLSVARATAGVNVNLLAADGPTRLESFSGMAQLTALVVDVRRAAGPQDASSWSGLPANVDAVVNRDAGR